MSVLEDLKPGLRLDGIVPGELVTVIAAQPHGPDVIERPAVGRLTRFGGCLTSVPRMYIILRKNDEHQLGATRSSALRPERPARFPSWERASGRDRWQWLDRHRRRLQSDP